MRIENSPNLPICLTGSLGLACLAALTSLFAGMLILWSLSCVGTVAVNSLLLT
jgi:hypothetical protein